MQISETEPENAAHAGPNLVAGEATGNKVSHHRRG
jgi:hypothetical protein